MAWYGSHVDASKKLDQIIDQNPTLQQLLNYPDFLQQLKAYNPKLLDFLTNSSHVIAQLITFLTIPPKQQDSDERKHKLPTICIQMIESDAMSILNAFFKENTSKKQKYLMTMFDQLLNNEQNNVNGEVLPLLAGYFLRVNISLLNNKYKQVVDVVYENEKLFEMLLRNSQSQSITNTLQVYLNLDLTKNSNMIPQRLNIKLKIIGGIMNIINKCIEQQFNNNSKCQIQSNVIKLENLSSVIIELLQKYYLIADGKQMIDHILMQENHVDILFNKKICSQNIVLDTQSYQIGIFILTIMASILKYYSFSSFNAQEWSNPEANKKNQLLLQSQLSIIKFIQLFPILIQQLNKCEKINLYHLKIIEIINTSFTLNSHKIFNCVKKHRYLETLIQMLFKFQKCNILGMMIEKLFLLIFRTERLINEEIKSYIFCEAKIIDLTAAKYMTEFTSDENLASSMGNSYRRKGYFGHLMKVMKIYSSIQTTNQDIVNAIRSKSETWNRVSRFILKPFQFINCKQLSTYENIVDSSPIEFSVRSIIGANNTMTPKKQIENIKLIQQINRQETLQNLKTLEGNSSDPKIQVDNFLSKNDSNPNQKTQKVEDQFFKPPTQNSPEKKSSMQSSFAAEIPTLQKPLSTQQTSSDVSQLAGELGLNKKALSYTDFMEKQKAKVQTQIKNQRSRSKERALSKGKAKITSPSPTKRVNKWAEGGQQPKQQTKQRVSLTAPQSRSSVTEAKVLPKIPHHKKGLNISTNANFVKDEFNKSMQMQKKSFDEEQIEKRFAKSMVDMNQLKKIKIIYQFQVPSKRQYRKINEQDRAVFDMLGISIQ